MAEFMPQIVDRFEYSSWKPGKDRDKFKQEIYPNRETQEAIEREKKKPKIPVRYIWKQGTLIKAQSWASTVRSEAQNPCPKGKSENGKAVLPRASSSQKNPGMGVCETLVTPGNKQQQKEIPFYHSLWL